jgi:methyltransferase (TIGR00027 family)
MHVEDVSDTARWMALFRADESERSDALFRDPYARQLAGDTNADIERLQRQGNGMAWAMVVRTAVIDQLILRLVRDHAIDTVLVLGAGLDTRPYRLALPPDLQWCELDLPGILARKQQPLQHETPTCRVNREPVDLSDAAARAVALDRVAQTSTKALVVCEGLLVYLPPPQVDALARDLAARTPFRWWITDMVSPALLAMMLKKAGAAPGSATTQYFGPREGTGFFRPSGWRETEYHSSLADAVRLQRAPTSMAFADWISRWVPGAGRLARIGGSVVMERC